MSMPHTHMIQPRNYKGMGPRKSTLTYSHNKRARSQIKRNLVSAVRETSILAKSAPPRGQRVNSVARKDTSSKPVSKKGARQRQKSKCQHTLDVTSNRDSSEYNDDFNPSAVSIHTIDNRKSCEVFAPVVFHSKVRKQFIP